MTWNHRSLHVAYRFAVIGGDRRGFLARQHGLGVLITTRRNNFETRHLAGIIISAFIPPARGAPGPPSG